MADAFIIEWNRVIPAAAAGGLIGFLSARLQDFLVRRRRFKALASALRAEVARLRKDFGEPVEVIEDWVGFGRAKGVPEIHPWIARIVLDSADLNPELAARFLTLDTQVNNYSHIFLSLRDARSKISETTQVDEAADLIESVAPASQRSSKDEQAEAEATFQLLQELAASIRRDAWQTLDRIDTLLARYARAPLTA